MYNLLCIFLIFYIYSVIGYIFEITYCSIRNKKITWTRGFLIGPYLPIYGTGSLILINTLARYADDYIVLFIMSMVYCSILEYITSYVLEKLFNLRWWDYSKRKFNLNGRVCLLNGVLFGIAGVFIVKFINPLITSFIYSMNYSVLTIISLILIIMFIIDLVLSIRIVLGLKNNIYKIINMDSTIEIKKEVFLFIKNNGMLTNRLLKSYPNLVSINSKKISEGVQFIKNELKKRKKTK